MKNRLLLVVLVTFVISMTVAPVSRAAELTAPAGTWLTLDDSGGLEFTTIRVEWAREAENALIVVFGPEKMRVRGWLPEVSNPGSYRMEFDRVSAGDVVEIELDLSGLSDGEIVRVAAERHVQGTVFQTAAQLTVGQGAVRMTSPGAYRITTQDSVDTGRQGEFSGEGQAGVIGSSSATVTVEPLDTKALEVAFAEDNANASIADGPRDCSLSVWAWAVSRTIFINSAPANALAERLTVHITVTHPDMSEIQMGLFDDDGTQTGTVVWNRGGGTDLDRDFVYDASHPHADLVGIGYPVNGWFTLVVRDCDGGNVGTLNYWSVSVEYHGSGDVDLVADTVSVSPDPVEPGGELRIVWEGHVAGTGPVPHDFDVGLYLSQDNNITTADELLASVNVSSAVDPGDPFGQGPPGRAVTLPSGLPEGTWYVGMRVDPAGEIVEVDEGNNVAWTSFEVGPVTEEVDLVADVITPATTSVEAGDALAVNWSGHLAASSNADVDDAFTVGFYLSPNAVVNTSDTLLDRVTITPPLAPGDGFGANGGLVTIPGGTAAGDWFIGMIVDDTGVVAETNENNNTQVAGIAVTVVDTTQADLQVRQCSITPGNVAPGGQATFAWQQRNGGDADAPPFHISIRLSKDQNGDPAADTILDSWTSTAWAANSAWASRSRSVDIPAGTADGTWYMLVALDDLDAVDESNENNNECSDELVVNTSQPSDPIQWLIPAAASAEGLNNSDWRTQIVVNNPTGDRREATVFYVADGSSWPGQRLIGPLQVQPSTSFYIDDLLVGLRPTTGLLYVVLDGEGPVVTSRTYNRANDGSTFGQGIPAIRLVRTNAVTEMVVPMVHSGAGRFRTNLGIAQASAGTMTVEITIYNASGAALASSTRVVTDAWEQINDVFTKLGIGTSVVEGGWIRVRLIGSGPESWACYGSVVDSVTGDPTYVVGVVP